LRNLFDQSSENRAEVNKKNFNNSIDGIIRKLESISKENISDEIDIKEIKSELERTRSIIAALIDIHWKNSLYEQLDPKLRAENTLYALCTLMIAQCIIQPIVLEIEDVQWLDNDSLEVLKVMTRNISYLPLVIICTGRYLERGKKFKIENERGSQEFEIDLDYLDKESIKVFAEKILKGKVDEAVVTFLNENTNGNPYFIEQLVLDFKERKIWEKKNKVYTLTENKNIEIPSSIVNVLISRFDRLLEEVKSVVQTASVLGREFEIKVLSQMLKDDAELNTKLKIAENEKIWYLMNELRYIFKHDLLRNAVYGMQLKSKLRTLHLLAAESIKNLHKKKTPQSVQEQMCYHLAIGNNIMDEKNRIVITKEQIIKDISLKEKVYEYVILQTEIADKYNENYRNEKALEVYDIVLRLVEIMKDCEKAYEVIMKKEEILTRTTRLSDAEFCTKLAMNYADKLKDRQKKELVNKNIARIYLFKSDYSKSIEFWNKLLKYFYSVKNNQQIISTLGSIGSCYVFKREFNIALKYFRKQYRKSIRTNFKEELAKSICHIGTVYNALGNFSKGEKYLNDGFKIFLKLKNKEWVARIYGELGFVYLLKDQYKKSLFFSNKSVKIYSELGFRLNVCSALTNVAKVYYLKSEYDKCINLFLKNAKLYKEINNLTYTALMYSNIGAVLIGKKDYRAALEYQSMSLKFNEGLKDKYVESLCLNNLGSIYVNLGKYKSGLDYYYKGLKISKKINNKESLNIAYKNIAFLYIHLKEYKKAHDYFKKALNFANKHEYLYNATKPTLIRYSEFLLNRGQVTKATEIINLGFSIFKKNQDDELIDLAKLLNERIKIYTYLSNFGFRKKNIKDEFDNKILEKHYRNILKLMKKLNEEEINAKTHFDLWDLAKKLKMLNIEFKNGERHKNRATKLYDELHKKYPEHNDYKVKLEELTKE